MRLIDAGTLMLLLVGSPGACRRPPRGWGQRTWSTPGWRVATQSFAEYAL